MGSLKKCLMKRWCNQEEKLQVVFVIPYFTYCKEYADRGALPSCLTKKGVSTSCTKNEKKYCTCGKVILKHYIAKVIVPLFNLFSNQSLVHG